MVDRPDSIQSTTGQNDGAFPFLRLHLAKSRRVFRRVHDMILLIGFVCLFSSYAAAHDYNFAYEGIHGPDYWSKEYNTCVGKHQSPINIEEHNVRNVTLPSLSFLNFDVKRTAILTNNGHTVMLAMNESSEPMALVQGGPLGNDTYVFQQLHFHWGQDDLEGSEDLINNHSYAMELHAVFYKKEYESPDEAMRHLDGLTVLAYFFEASNKDNPIYAPIVKTLPNIEEKGKTKLIPLILETLLLPKKELAGNYFTYNGSLTTPPCSEIVTWIDFKEPLVLSHDQIAAFRDVRSSEGGKMTHNFRPVQPLADRFVFHNIPDGNYPGIEDHLRDITEMHKYEHDHHHHHHRAHVEGQNSGPRGAGVSAIIAIVALLASVR